MPEFNEKNIKATSKENANLLRFVEQVNKKMTEEVIDIKGLLEDIEKAGWAKMKVAVKVTMAVPDLGGTKQVLAIGDRSEPVKQGNQIEHYFIAEPKNLESVLKAQLLEKLQSLDSPYLSRMVVTAVSIDWTELGEDEKPVKDSGWGYRFSGTAA